MATMPFFFVTGGNKAAKTAATKYVGKEGKEGRKERKEGRRGRKEKVHSQFLNRFLTHGHCLATPPPRYMSSVEPNYLVEEKFGRLLRTWLNVLNPVRKVHGLC